jgi:hypothetical protein
MTEEKKNDNPGEDNAQGVLSTRFGEWFQLFEEDPGGPFVYAVALVEVPPLPEPASSKGEGLALVVAGRCGTEGRWGYFHAEKDAKQEVASYLHDDCKVEVGRWYFLRLTTERPKTGETE